jgi:hypothetical protein
MPAVSLFRSPAVSLFLVVIFGDSKEKTPIYILTEVIYISPSFV